MTTVLIAGSAGQLGAELMTLCRARPGWRTFGLARRATGQPQTLPVDLTQDQALLATLDALTPSLIINAAATLTATDHSA